MPVANFEQYCNMLDNAKKNKFAYPAINVSSPSTANAALQAFAEAGSDGIIEVSTGGGQYNSGSVKDSALGAISIAQHVHLMAERYGIYVALHTDHCLADKLDSFVHVLMEETKKRRAMGLPNLYQSHMFDGSTVSMKENMEIAKPLLAQCADLEIILECEIGAVGGEEDGMDNEGLPAEKLYTTVDDMLYTYEQLSQVANGRYMLAATFGNVHGVYKPGGVQLKPKILRDGQQAIAKKFGSNASFDYVFHGGSGSSQEEIRETLEYGVIKMNVDTDTQYAYARPVVDHMFKNYDAVLKIDGELGNKKMYDPRCWGKKAEAGMAERIKEAVEDLNATGKSLFKG